MPNFDEMSQDDIAQQIDLETDIEPEAVDFKKVRYNLAGDGRTRMIARPNGTPLTLRTIYFKGAAGDNRQAAIASFDADGKYIVGSTVSIKHDNAISAYNAPAGAWKIGASCCQCDWDNVGGYLDVERTAG